MPVFPLKTSTKRNLLCAALGGALVTLMFSAAPARAQEESVEQKFLDGMMGLIGLSRKPGDIIEYRERSPLVIPPSANASLGGAGTLPPPQSDKIANPNWPVDPEIKEARALAAATKGDGSNSSQVFEQNARPVLPSELQKGRTNKVQNNKNGGEKSSSRLTSSELGYSGGMFSNIFGSRPDEFATFTGEPVRDNLTAPPVGYQTPSPTQPYAVGPTTVQNKPFDYYTDRSLGK